MRTTSTSTWSEARTAARVDGASGSIRPSEPHLQDEESARLARARVRASSLRETRDAPTPPTTAPPAPRPARRGGPVRCRVRERQHGGSDGASGPPDADAGSELSGEITVSAAASLTEAFTELGEGFEAANPDTTVTFTFDSSGTLSEQILDRAPRPTCSPRPTRRTWRSSSTRTWWRASPRCSPATSWPSSTKPGNPEGIETLADLADAGVVSLCGEDVPCGKFAAAGPRRRRRRRSPRRA